MIYLANTDSDPLKNINISSLDQFKTFLETKNEYTQFIFEKLKEEPITTTAEEKNIAGMFGKVIAKRRDSTLGWSIKINIMAIRSQAIDTSMEGSETTGEVEPS
jgi:hypothetical protein